MSVRKAATIVFCGVAATLVGCGQSELEPPPAYQTEQKEKLRQQYGTIHGDEGFVLFSNRGREDGAGSGGGAIGVNPFLWRGALETIDFMPLTSTDPFGGVIITDWYSPPETPDERFKINVYILDKALRADGVKVSVFRQTRAEGGWSDATVDPKTATSIEDSILTRARELRIAAQSAEQ
jgi:hypothetical protein